jgi:hypothetical protein
MAEPDVSVVVVTYDARPWLERCLESVAGLETVVVDHGSTDGTQELVRARFPEARLLERENRGLGAGWNAGMQLADGRYFLLLNADAWAVGDAVRELVEFADAHADVALVGPRLHNPDGSLQRSVRGFPTPWRLATEYFFLRKLAPRSRALNGFYAGGFPHDRAVDVEWLMGACMLVRRAAVDEVGPLDEAFFLFSEETDWCWRFRQAGWRVAFCPEAEFVHVGGASHGGRMFRENVRGNLRFLAKHRGARQAERARRLMLLALRLRGLLFRGDRGAMYRDAARMLAGRPVAAVLDQPR